MGYNLKEAIEYVKKNKNSQEVQDFLKGMVEALSETSLDESEESKKN